MTSERTSLAGSTPPSRSDQALVGPADPTRELTVTIYLWRGDGVACVEAFAAEYGLQVIDVDQAAGRVRVAGTVAQLERAFGVQLYEYRWKGGEFISHSGPVSVPTELGDVAEAVLGLDTHPVARPLSETSD
jgi:subtilase family serine protease